MGCGSLHPRKLRLITLGVSALVLSILLPARAQAGTPPLVINGNTACFPTTQRYHETCTPQPDGSRLCAFPSMAPCQDKDRDGLFSCASNTQRMRFVDISEINPDFSLKEPLASPLLDPPNTGIFDWIGLSDCAVVEMPYPGSYSSKITTPHSCCGATWGAQGGLDCDDSSALIGSRDNSANTAPIRSIAFIGRDSSAVEEARKHFSVNLSRFPAFNPYDTVVIAIQTHPCVSYLPDVAISLDLGVGQPISLGTTDFFDSNHAGFFLNPPTDAPKGAGILYGRFSLHGVISPEHDPEILRSMLAKIRVRRELAGHKTTTTAGPVPAKIIVSTSFGSRSVPISLDTCVPIFGDGPISITTRRPTNLREFLPESWVLRPIDFARAFVTSTLEAPPFKQNKQLFSVVADLSLVTEREKAQSEDGTSDIEVTGPASCGGRFWAYESAFNWRAYASWGNGLVMDPTDPSYRNININHAKALSSDIYLLVVTHEFGHVLGSLRDEYDNFKGNHGSHPDYQWLRARNCAGPISVRTAFPPPGNVAAPDRAICGARGNYRSTIASRMNVHTSYPKFNVTSCAYLLAEMRGGSAPDYFKTCEQKEYDTYRE